MENHARRLAPFTSFFWAQIQMVAKCDRGVSPNKRMQPTHQPVIKFVCANLSPPAIQFHLKLDAAASDAWVGSKKSTVVSVLLLRSRPNVVTFRARAIARYDWCCESW